MLPPTPGSLHFGWVSFVPISSNHRPTPQSPRPAHSCGPGVVAAPELRYPAAWQLERTMLRCNHSLHHLWHSPILPPPGAVLSTFKNAVSMRTPSSLHYICQCAAILRPLPRSREPPSTVVGVLTPGGHRKCTNQKQTHQGWVGGCKDNSTQP